MKIYIVSMEEPFYLPVFFEKIIKVFKEDIVGISVLKHFPGGKSLLQYAYDQFLLFGGLEFLLFSVYSCLYKVVDTFFPLKKRRRVYSIKKLAEKYNISFRYEKDINDPEFSHYLHKLEVDILITQVSQIFKKNILSTPKWGCINKHASLLPQFRGLYPVYWAMALKARKTGVTIYRMDKRIDGGTILAQTQIDITPQDTVVSLYNQIFRQGAELLIDVLHRLNRNERPPFKIVKNVLPNGYFSFPDKNTRRIFRKLGFRFGNPASIQFK